MKRRLPQLVVLLSLLLSAASAGMWVRSTFAEDVWVSSPRPVERYPGCWWFRTVGSVDGRLALTECVKTSGAPPRLIDGVDVGYLSSPPATTFDRSAVFAGEYSRVSAFELPFGLGEWAWARPMIGRRWLLAVSWRLLVVLFALPAALRVVWRIWLRHRHRVPAFPVDVRQPAA